MISVVGYSQGGQDFWGGTEQIHYFNEGTDISCLSVSFITGHPCLLANPHASANIKESLWRVPILREMQRERLRENRGTCIGVNKGHSVGGGDKKEVSKKKKKKRENN